MLSSMMRDRTSWGDYRSTSTGTCQLIVFHAYYSPLVPRINSKNMAQDWFRTTITLKSYADKCTTTILAAALETVRMKPITTTCAGIS
jgi:hypothetical protein